MAERHGGTTSVVRGGDRGVSVVIPCHATRRWPQLRAAVDSVRAQSAPPTEIVVSVDHSDELLERARRELSGVTVLANRLPPGVSGARNTGVAHTCTPLVALLDDDARAQPGWLERLITPFSDPDVIGTGGTILPRWQRARPFWFPDEFLWAVVATAALPQTPVSVRNVWSASMAVRREAFDAVGGFRLGFGKRGRQSRPEDTDLCLRMSRVTGGHWVYSPDAVVQHDVPNERSTLRYLIARCFHEGRGKVELARLSGGFGSFNLERDYLCRTLPRVVLRNLGAALTGRGAFHAAQAGVVLLASASALAGGLVETGHGWNVRMRRLARWGAPGPHDLTMASGPLALSAPPARVRAGMNVCADRSQT